MGQRPSGRLIARCLRAIAAAGAVALAAGAPAAGAQTPPTQPPQQQDPQGSPPTITPPADHGAIRTDTAPVTASGSFTTKNPGSTIIGIHVHLDWTGPGSRPGLPSDQELCAGTTKPPCGGPSATYSTPLSPVAFNGPYHVDVTASSADVLNNVSTRTVGADFVLAIPPKTPTGLKATANKDRTVSVVWDRNAEADLYYYELGRKGPGDKDFKIIALIPQPPAAKPSRVDNTVPPGAGDYQYQVTAVRYGQTGDNNPNFLVRSGPAGPVTVKLGPAPPGSTTPPATQPPPAGLPSGLPALKFSSGKPPSLSTAKSSSTPTTEEVVPDPGFVQNLPYANRANPNDEGDNPAVELHRKGGKASSNKGVLIPGAVGAILFVGAFQLRWLMRTIDQPLIPPVA